MDAITSEIDKLKLQHADFILNLNNKYEVNASLQNIGGQEELVVEEDQDESTEVLVRAARHPLEPMKSLGINSTGCNSSSLA